MLTTDQGRFFLALREDILETLELLEEEKELLELIFVKDLVTILVDGGFKFSMDFCSN